MDRQLVRAASHAEVIDIYILLACPPREEE